ncbi:hypothetical protein NE237_019171 [Protea cynaroides]|uniref:Uncharacterized protein n=1 Tax=Protea cynaroides TaxID=273540 RepID=A0A9Q0KBA8_9MAGN|nr:hypothetical protein NE237_019171 [Protea cynaroides]
MTMTFSSEQVLWKNFKFLTKEIEEKMNKMKEEMEEYKRPTSEDLMGCLRYQEDKLTQLLLKNFRNQRQTWRSFIVIEWDKVDFFQLLLHILTTTRHVRASYLWTIFSNSSTYILECRKVFQFASNLRKHEHSHEMKSQSTHESKHSLRSDHFPVEFVDVTRSSNTDM